MVSELFTLSFHVAQFEFLGGGQLEGIVGKVRTTSCLPPSTTTLLFDRELICEAGEIALSIPIHHLQRTVVARSEDAAAFVGRTLPRMLGVDRPQRAVSRLVAGLIYSDMRHASHSDLSLENIARRLGYSPATLRRRLAAEGLGFRQVRESVFGELAKDWLREGIAVSVIAEKLGYSDAFAFRRAFHRSYGCSPTEFRHTMTP
jgi:AraC-like DNA-binding protein